MDSMVSASIELEMLAWPAGKANAGGAPRWACWPSCTAGRVVASKTFGWRSPSTGASRLQAAPLLPPPPHHPHPTPPSGPSTSGPTPASCHPARRTPPGDPPPMDCPTTMSRSTPSARAHSAHCCRLTMRSRACASPPTALPAAGAGGGPLRPPAERVCHRPGCSSAGRSADGTAHAGSEMAR